jgi:NADH:ubiquinone oxidoreductase subunit 3 (subunit A)
MVHSFPITPPVEHPWATIVVLLGAAVVFGSIPLSLAWLWARIFSPAKPGLQKNATYECGLEAKGDAWIQLDVSYYLYAIVFLIFDVEAVFLLPFAAAFQPFAGGLSGYAGFPAVIGGGPGLGLPKRRVDLELMRFGWIRT